MSYWPEVTEKYPDGREVCIKGEYLYRLRMMASRQHDRCAICERILVSMVFDHEAGRGMGGGHRDDRIEKPDGTWQNAALCYRCNSLKASKRYAWKHGVYLPV